MAYPYMTCRMDGHSWTEQDAVLQGPNESEVLRTLMCDRCWMLRRDLLSRKSGARLKRPIYQRPKDYSIQGQGRKYRVEWRRDYFAERFAPPKPKRAGRRKAA